MERLKPTREDPGGSPVFKCNSIQEIFSSRQFILDEMNWWAANEAGKFLKYAHYGRQLTETPIYDLIRGKRNSECGTVFISILSIKHDPNIDRERNLNWKRIAIVDSTEDLLYVELPNLLGMKVNNLIRRKEGLPELTRVALAENFWTANVTLDARYSSHGDRFRICKIEQEQIRISKEEREDIARELKLQPV